MAYTDALNGAIDSLTTTLTAVTGLRVVNDPTRLVPNCVYIDAPSFTTIAGNGNIIRMDFPIKVIGSGPAGLPVLRSILDIDCVLFFGDQVHAGAAAAVDLMQQTGPSTVLENRVFTGAQ